MGYGGSGALQCYGNASATSGEITIGQHEVVCVQYDVHITIVSSIVENWPTERDDVIDIACVRIKRRQQAAALREH